MDTDFESILAKIRQFRDDRDWMQFHDAKSMAASICIEAAELLEHFQWKKEYELTEYIDKNKEEIGKEIADVAMYLFELADNLDIDLFNIMAKKLEKNAEKYPIKKAKGIHTKYDKL